MALLPQPPYLPTDSFGDKIQHIIGFSTLAVLASVAFPAMPRWQVIERLSFFGAFIEVAQSIPALGRDCDILDWVADTLAVMVVVFLLTLLLGRPERGGLRFPT
jgi:VanZ family protein